MFVHRDWRKSADRVERGVSRYRLVTTVPPPVLERVHERVHKGDATIGGFLVRSQVRSPVNPPIIVFRACVCAEDIVQRGRGDAAANKGEFSSFHRGEMAEVYLLLRTAVLYPFSCSSFLRLARLARRKIARLVSLFGWNEKHCRAVDEFHLTTNCNTKVKKLMSRKEKEKFATPSNECCAHIYT